MTDRAVTLPPVDRLERGELLALTKIVSAGRISNLDIASARWEAAGLRWERLSSAVVVALRDYTEARARLDKAKAEGRGTKTADRTVGAAYAAYRRASAAADAAYEQYRRRYADLHRIREGTDT